MEIMGLGSVLVTQTAWTGCVAQLMLVFAVVSADELMAGTTFQELTEDARLSDNVAQEVN